MLRNRGYRENVDGSDLDDLKDSDYLNTDQELLDIATEHNIDHQQQEGMLE